MKSSPDDIKITESSDLALLVVLIIYLTSQSAGFSVTRCTDSTAHHLS